MTEQGNLWVPFTAMAWYKILQDNQEVAMREEETVIKDQEKIGPAPEVKVAGLQKAGIKGLIPLSYKYPTAEAKAIGE
eukprot:CAMPEP_0179303292 /NCGR_PEP_ID=MMETSP0797-20121207/48504_1 /TAXON_ID=47934 /ORGANISM="Dinophysis acuminata, Strain DAEP01" /LENGTH=77 /DNA_ID=CAMNT_0021012847 /DNA_START=103 /DNA_END=336 /DNA_ORIENTATION=-